MRKNKEIIKFISSLYRITHHMLQLSYDIRESEHSDNKSESISGGDPPQNSYDMTT